MNQMDVYKPPKTLFVEQTLARNKYDVEERTIDGAEAAILVFLQKPRVKQSSSYQISFTD